MIVISPVALLLADYDINGLYKL